MKVRIGIIYTDRTGKDWICDPYGKKVSFTGYGYTGWEENLIDGLRTITHDSDLKVEKVLLSSSSSNSDITLINTGNSYYFTKKIDNNHFEAYVNEAGIGFGDSNTKIIFTEEQNYTVFFFVNKATGKKCSKFYFLKW